MNFFPFIPPSCFPLRFLFPPAPFLTPPQVSFLDIRRLDSLHGKSWKSSHDLDPSEPVRDGHPVAFISSEDSHAGAESGTPMRIQWPRLVSVHYQLPRDAGGKQSMKPTESHRTSFPEHIAAENRTGASRCVISGSDCVGTWRHSQRTSLYLLPQEPGDTLSHDAAPTIAAENGAATASATANHPPNALVMQRAAQYSGLFRRLSAFHDSLHRKTRSPSDLVGPSLIQDELREQSKTSRLEPIKAGLQTGPQTTPGSNVMQSGGFVPIAPRRLLPLTLPAIKTELGQSLRHPRPPQPELMLFPNQPDRASLAFTNHDLVKNAAMARGSVLSPTGLGGSSLLKGPLITTRDTETRADGAKRLGRARVGEVDCSSSLACEDCDLDGEGDLEGPHWQEFQGPMYPLSSHQQQPEGTPNKVTLHHYVRIHAI